MTERQILIDTGPLIAICSTRDQHHDACVRQLKELQCPLVTCWPVLTEAVWLLRNHPQSIERLFRAFEGGMFELLALDPSALTWIAKFLKRYKRLGAQLADATLVYLAEEHAISTVFTLDRRDFSIYRLKSNRGLKLIPA